MLTEIGSLPHGLRAVALVLIGNIFAFQALGDTSQVEEMTVLGQPITGLRLTEDNYAGSRLGLSAFQTPASVDLILAEEMTLRGDFGTHEAITRSAGISSIASPGNGSTAISSRGFTGNVATAFTYDGARLYVTAGTVTFPADTWTLDRVEILRGAGSVINGLGALGTTINYVPKSPDFTDPDFDLSVSAGRFDTVRVAAGGGAAINDQWAWRLDGVHFQSDGFSDRSDEERNVVSGSIVFRPSHEFRVQFSIDYADLDDAPFWGTPLVDGEASRRLRKNNYNFQDAFVSYEDLWVHARIDWDINPGVRLRNDTYFISAEREWQNIESYAYVPETNTIDRSDYLGIGHDTTQVGTRIDLLFEYEFAEREHRTNIGVEGNLIDLDYDSNFSMGAFGLFDSVPVFGFDPGRMPRESIPTVPDFKTDSTQYAVYFDNVFSVSDQVSLIAGGRFDRYEFKRDQLEITLPDGALVRPGSSFDANLQKFTWRVGIVVSPVESLSFYGQFSTAADPVTSPATISAALADFDLTTGRQIEVGLKQRLWSDRAEMTLAYFDISQKNIVTRLPGSPESEQIGEQASEGFEFTFRTVPIGRVAVEFNAARVRAIYNEFYSGMESLAGNRPRNVPKTTASLWMNWTAVDNVLIGAGLRYVDSRYLDNENTRLLPSYTVADAMVSWEMMESLAFTFRARNLTDKNYATTNYISPDQWIFGQPRSYEVGFRYSFGG